MPRNHRLTIDQKAQLIEWAFPAGFGEYITGHTFTDPDALFDVALEWVELYLASL